MAYETILYEKKDRVAYITLNRPQVLNAINDQMSAELVDAAKAFDSDQDLWVAILSGNGRLFSSGADVKQRQLRPREELVKFGTPGGALRPPGGGFGLGETVNWKPVIAAVHGWAIGAGFGFAVDCDLIVAAEGTKFQIREAQRGLGGSPHWVSAYYWGGARLASEMVITGRTLEAGEAYRLGMVNRVVPLEQMMPEAERLAEEVLAMPPLSVRGNVRMCRWFVLEQRRVAEMYQQGLKLHLTEDFHESARAFVEKRKANFQAK